MFTTKHSGINLHVPPCIQFQCEKVNQISVSASSEAVSEEDEDDNDHNCKYD